MKTNAVPNCHQQRLRLPGNGEKNVGIGILPIFLANEYSESPDIFEIKENTDRTLAFAYGNKKEVSPLAKKFIQSIESRDPISF